MKNIYRPSAPNYSRLMQISLVVVVTISGSALADPIDFNRDIKPILADRCFHCHGPDTNKIEGDLRLDIEEEAKKFAISPGDVEDSELITRIYSDDPEERMPSKDSGKPPLSSVEKELFKRWIEEGAVWDTHWAWRTPERPAIPLVQHKEIIQNDIDHFIINRLEKDGRTISQEAAKETLIRRVSLDITGIPPTPKEITAFLKDKSPDAYSKLLDRLFASPHYGERMTIEWLDGARYADSNGFQNDFGRAMWPWRDWVIDAFNDNMPYDQFVVEQIAGDLLPNPTDSQLVATGFNRNNRANTEGGSIEEEWHVENIVDRVETIGNMFMGLTIGCARCHDHKYDPISQKDFYRFFAFLNNTEDRGFYEETRGNTGPQIELASPEQQKQIDEFDIILRKAAAARDTKKESLTSQYADWENVIREYTPAPNAVKPALHVALDSPESVTAKLDWSEGLLGNTPMFTGKAEAVLDLGKPLSFNPDQPFTLAAWVYREKAGTLFTTFDAELNNRGIDLRFLDSGTLRFNMANEMDNNAVRLNTEARIPTKTWAHVALTYSSKPSFAGIQIYINGSLARATAEINKLKGTFATDQPLRLGGRSDGEFYTGKMTDVRVYDIALESTQISNVFFSGLHERLPETLTEESKTKLTKLKNDQINYVIAKEQSDVAKAERKRNDFVSKNIPTVMIMKERTEIRPTFRLERGMYDKPDTSEQLTPAIPAFLPPLPEGAPANRLGLAQWLVSPENPLMARVTVNRLWQQYFGQGLVKTPENFGTQSEMPSNPELLDWLATELIRLNWDLKAFQKTMLMSATYRQNSNTNDDLLNYDPENRLLARGPRFRLQAELIRDNALAISGLLSDTIGGPPVKPYQPDGMWKELAGGAGQGDYVRGEGEDLYRRSLYTFRKRTIPHATLSTFDAPSFELCRVLRGRTNTPLQALALLNDTTYVEAARQLAYRMMDEGGRRNTKRIAYGFRLATGRFPSEEESTLLAQGLESYMELFKNEPEAAEEFIQNGDSTLSGRVKTIQLASYMAIANAILNLDETITRE